MAINDYRIKEFFGIDQSTEQGSIDIGASPDACNMDTGGGNLSIAKGFIKRLFAPIPGEKPIRRLFAWQSLVTSRLVAVAGNEIYACMLTDETPEWTRIFTYPDTVKCLRLDTELAQIESNDYLLIACGEHALIKWNGVDAATVFGTSAKQSDKKANYLAMHYGRLFAAGDPENPSRLYWSKTPGDGRSIEDWRTDAASENTSGGHVEVGDTSGDPITGLLALSNQLLIFKRHSVYRLLGDRPSNYRVYRVYAEVDRMQNSACALYGDVPYWMTGGGLYYFDGQTALLSRTAKKLRNFLEHADFSNCRAAKKGTKLYFTAYEKDRDESAGGVNRTQDNAIVVYDTERQTYMLRRGFTVSDLCAHESRLYMVNTDRYVYAFEEGADYDGRPIAAYWQTPLTDLGYKQGVKTLLELYLRGHGDGRGEGAAMLLDAKVGKNRHSYRYLMPEMEEEVLEIPLKNEGRTFSLRFYNEEGSRFTITGGVHMVFDLRLRTT